LGEIPVQTRFAIATAAGPPAPAALPPPSRDLPPVLEPSLEPSLPEGERIIPHESDSRLERPTTRLPKLDPSVPDRIILFINGSDSRLEEADDLIPKLVRLPDGRASGFTVITMDLPGSGYASQIDHTEVGSWAPAISEVGIPIGWLGP